MRINKINSSNFRNIKSTKPNRYITNAIADNKISKDNFQKINSINFKSGYSDINDAELDADNYIMTLKWEWDEGSVSCQKFAKASNKFYEKHDYELREIARELCLYTDDDIYEFCRVWKKVLGFRFEKPELGKLNLERLMPFIEEARNEVKHHLCIVIKHDEDEVDKGINTIEYKEKISKLLFEPIEIEQEGKERKVRVANGILLYGNNESQKNELEDWIKSKSTMRIAKIEYRKTKPQESIDAFKKEMETAKKIFQHGGQRTLLDISSFDNLFTNYENPNSRRLIAQFKNLAEIASKEYGTTLFMKTSMPYSSFEPASVGFQRFDIQANTTKYVNDIDAPEFKDTVYTLQDLRRLAIQADGKYTEETRLDYYEVEKLQD